VQREALPRGAALLSLVKGFAVPSSPLLDFFGCVEIIHLPARTDRYASLARELARIGIDVEDPRVRFPDPPMPADPDGFPSRGVYGNHLSHLDILRRARDANAPAVWVLEDDAIFRSSLARPGEQQRIVALLQQQPWDMCFLGHAFPNSAFKSAPKGLVPVARGSKWAHCYAVHQSALPRLVDYLEGVERRPAGHPEGGKMYIDGSFSLFREHNPDFIALFANPVLSVQRGSTSSLASHWSEKLSPRERIVQLGRACRDEMWRRTGIYVWNAPTP
jgi:glycosyl transferase, family 25